MIVGSQSGQYIVALLNKADAVVPPELHQVIDPYLNKVQERLNPNHQASWPGGATPQPTVPAQSAGWSWPSWPKGEQAPQLPNVELPKVEWPQSAPATQQPAWPTQTQTAPATNSVYGSPREPNQFPDPYSAERPTGARVLKMPPRSRPK